MPKFMILRTFFSQVHIYLGPLFTHTHIITQSWSNTSPNKKVTTFLSTDTEELTSRNPDLVTHMQVLGGEQSAYDSSPVPEKVKVTSVLSTGSHLLEPPVILTREKVFIL